MKLLVVGVLAAALAVLLTVTLLVQYRDDRQTIRWFPGTGIAAKLDVLGPPPAYVSITDTRTGEEYTFAVDARGTFIAALPPDVYRVELPGDDRAVTLDVPRGECLDLLLDYRFPLVVLSVPKDGPPLPRLAA